jgi:hypothetical protein
VAGGEVARPHERASEYGPVAIERAAPCLERARSPTSAKCWHSVRVALVSVSEAVALVLDAIDAYAPQLARHTAPRFSPSDVDRLRAFVGPDHLSGEVIEYLAGPRPLTVFGPPEISPLYGHNQHYVEWLMNNYGNGDVDWLSRYYLPIRQGDYAMFFVIAYDQPCERSPLMVWDCGSPNLVCAPFPSLRTYLLSLAKAVRLWSEDPAEGPWPLLTTQWFEFLIGDPNRPVEPRRWDALRDDVLALLAREDESPLWPGAPMHWSGNFWPGDPHHDERWLPFLRPTASMDFESRPPRHRLRDRRPAIDRWRVT